MSAATPSLSIDDILELAGECEASDVRQLTLRGQGITSFAQFTPQLPSLEGLSLSHNQLCTLEGLKLLANLVTLNVNNNLLPSLAGLESCYSLQQLYAANNRIRDLQPLAGLTQIHTLNCMKNSISSLDHTLKVLAHLPSLTDLDLSVNPVAAVPSSKHTLIYHLPSLQLLDGDRVSTVDRAIATDQLAPNAPDIGNASHAVHAGTTHADILVLDHVDGDAAGDKEYIISKHTGSAASGVSSSAEGQHIGLQKAGSAIIRPLTASMRPSTANARPSTASARPGTSQGYTQQLCSDPGLNDHPLLLEYLAKHVLIQGLAAAGQHQPAAAVGSRARGSFAARLRTTATVMAGTESLGVKDLANTDAVQAALPGSSHTTAVQELLRDATPQELIRQLVRLAEILIQEIELLKQGGQSTSRPTSSSARPRSGGSAQGVNTEHIPAVRPMSSGVKATDRTSSSIMEAPSTQGLAGSLSLPSKSGSVFIITDKASYSDKGIEVRPESPLLSKTSGQPGKALHAAVPGTASSGSGSRPGSKGCPELSAQEELSQLRRQVKHLQLENQNMYWLADEYKRLKAELAQASDARQV